MLLGLRLGTAEPTSEESRRKERGGEGLLRTVAVFVSAPAGVRGQKRFVDDEEKGCSRRMQTGEESARAMASRTRGPS